MHLRLPAIVVSVCFLAAHIVAQETAASSPADQVRLREGTAIELRLAQTLSSRTARVGDRVEFVVWHEVRLDQLVVIPKGAAAWGQVAAVARPRRKGKPGSLEIGFEGVLLITGGTAAIRSAATGQGQPADIAGHMLGATLQTYGLGLPLAPLFLLEKGSEAVLQKGLRVTAAVSGEVVLDRSLLLAAQSKVPPAYRGPPVVYAYPAPDTPFASYPVYCGKVPIAKVRAGHYLRFELPPGTYCFRSSDQKSTVLSLMPDTEYYFRLFSVPTFWSSKGRLRPVDASNGENEVFPLEPLARAEVTDLGKADPAALQAPEGTPLTAQEDSRVQPDHPAITEAPPLPSNHHGPPRVLFFEPDDPALLGRWPKVECGVARIGRLRPGHYFSVELPPGRYWFSSDMNSVEVELENDHLYFFRMSSNSSGVRTRGTLERVSQETAEAQIAVLAPSFPADLRDLGKIDPAALRAVPERK